MRASIVCVPLSALIVSSAVHARPLLHNGGFETTRVIKGKPHGDVGFGLWRLGAQREAPTHWTLNSAFPGECLMPSQGARSGKRFLRVRATGKRGTAHVYQPCRGLDPTARYKITAWVRGGKLSIQFYEYFKKGPMGGQRVLTAAADPKRWKQVVAYYSPRGGDNFGSASLAFEVAKGETLDTVAGGDLSGGRRSPRPLRSRRQRLGVERRRMEGQRGRSTGNSAD